MKNSIKHIASLAMIVMLAGLGSTIASASVVTGTLSSSGVSSSETGTTGTLSGTVSNPVAASSGGGGGGGGGGGVISGPLAVGTTNSSGSGTGVVSTPQGAVLGVSTDVPNIPVASSAGNIGTSGTQTEAPLALNAEVATPQANTALVAAVAASGTGIALWWFWLALVLLLIVAAYAGWRYYQDNYNKRRYY